MEYRVNAFDNTAKLAFRDYGLMKSDQSQDRSLVKGLNLQLTAGHAVALQNVPPTISQLIKRSILNTLPETVKLHGQINVYDKNDTGELSYYEHSSFALHRSLGDQLTQVLRITDGLNFDESRKLSVAMLRRLGLRNIDDLLHALPDEVSDSELYLFKAATTLLKRPGVLIMDAIPPAISSDRSNRLIDIIQELVTTGMSVLIFSRDKSPVSMPIVETFEFDRGRFFESENHASSHSQRQATA